MAPFISVLPVASTLSSSSPLLSPPAVTASLGDYRTHLSAVALSIISFNGPFSRAPCICSKGAGSVLKAISDAEVGVSTTDNELEAETDEEDNLPLDKLPPESKLLMKLEHKMKMKLAKKVKLRRKKLVRKRRMRKKGSWPPSKMNKLKNV